MITDSKGDIRSAITAYRTGLQRVLSSIPETEIEKFIATVADVALADRTILVAGNGGSAATASHMACDLAKTALGRTRPSVGRRFRVVALTDNVPLMSAWANDVGYETVFAEQVRAIGEAGDLLIVISASGNSPNILAAVQAARESGLRTEGLLGCGGGLAVQLLDHAVVVPSSDFGYVEDSHLVLIHLMTAYFRRLLSSEGP